MSKEKQIEEMAKELCGMNITCEHCKLDKLCLARNSADILYNAGYRKQEWISVEDDKPKNQMARVQVFLRSDEATDAIGFPKIDTDRYIDGKWVRWGRHVTHWMPLPEPPIEKGERQ